MFSTWEASTRNVPGTLEDWRLDRILPEIGRSKLGCNMGHHGVFRLGVSVFVEYWRIHFWGPKNNPMAGPFDKSHSLMQFENEPRNLFSEADYVAAGYYDVFTFRRLLVGQWLLAVPVLTWGRQCRLFGYVWI